MNYYANKSTVERYKTEKALDEMVREAQELGLYEYTTKNDNPLDK